MPEGPVAGKAQHAFGARALHPFRAAGSRIADRHGRNLSACSAAWIEPRAAIISRFSRAAEPMTKQTILNATHRAAGAKMVDFGGWDMPLHYGSQLEEHHAVRHDAGMFD